MNKEAIAHLKKVDPRMKALIQRIGPLDFKPNHHPVFKSFARSIVHQQLSGNAAQTIFKRFSALAPKKKFPSIEFILTLTETELRAVGLSRPKISYIQDLARKISAKEIPELRHTLKMTDQDILEKFVLLRGVGKWTVEMFLIFNLGRPDILPADDLGIRKGFTHVYGKRKLASPESILKYGKIWAPYRTTASLYLWRAADAEKK